MATGIIHIPISIPENKCVIVPKEEYIINYGNCKAKLRIDGWTYCTAFNVTFDESKIATTEKKNGRSHVLLGNNLLEFRQHDIADITFYYREILTELLSAVKESEIPEVLGTRGCGDMHINANLNKKIDINRLVFHCPVAQRLGKDAVLLQLCNLPKKFTPEDAISLFRFSVNEYEKLCQNESLHLEYDKRIDSRIKHDDIPSDTGSVFNSKVVITSNGNMHMTGVVNRRSMLVAFYNVLEVLNQCQ